MKQEYSKPRIIGVGGAGINVVNSIFNKDTESFNMAICGTDSKVMLQSSISKKLLIKPKLEKETSYSERFSIYKGAALKQINDIENLFAKKDKMAIVIAGMAGNTGTGLTPIVANAVKKIGLITIAIIITPFNFEGELRKNRAKEGLLELENYADIIFTLGNEHIVKKLGHLCTYSEGFEFIDKYLFLVVNNVLKISNFKGCIELDFVTEETISLNQNDMALGEVSLGGKNVKLIGHLKPFSNDK